MPELRFREVHSGCPLEVVPGDGNGALLIAADRGENINDIEGITGAQLGAAVGDAELAQLSTSSEMPREEATRRKISSKVCWWTGSMKILLWMRRRKASSAKSLGSRLVAKTTITSKGIWNFTPYCNER